MARDHKQTLAARNALAYAQGYRGKGGGQSGAYAAARRAREAGQALPTDYTAQPSRQQVTRLGGGRRLVRDLPSRSGRGGDRVLASQLGRSSGQVSATVTVRGPDGQLTTLNLFQRGGWSASQWQQALAQAGGDVRQAMADLVNSGAGVTGTAGSLGLGFEVEAQDIEEVELDLSA